MMDLGMIEKLADYQKAVHEAVHRQGTGYWSPLEIHLRLSEEQGEIARELNHLHGPKKRKPDEKEGNLSYELGDMIFTVICMANSHGIDLNESLRHAIAKCDGRDKDRFKKKRKASAGCRPARRVGAIR